QRRGPPPHGRVAARRADGVVLGHRAVKPIISVIGGGTCTPDEAAVATMVGRLLAEQGAILVCGGLGGVMEAAAQGAQAAGGITVGLLPGADPAAANPYIAVPLATRLGEMRNVLIVQVAQALIAIGGGSGTLSEIAVAQRIGKPVVGLHDAFMNAVDIPRVGSPADAVRWALERAQGRVV
ncbi:MAG: TIGR00725 family protein, partial [Gemmatimonadales bacterium]